MAFVTVFALNGAALADTYWSNTAPASVTDLLNADNWTNGAPTTADNPGFITGKTITVSNDFYPGANGQDIDITFNGATSTTFSKGFVPLKNLPNGNTATFTMRLQDSANVYVTNNFWGGNNNTGQSYDQSGKDYLIYQYYGGNSTFSCNEWWTAMTARTYIEISDNAVVTARGGTNSGLGWDNAAPYTADGSKLEMSGKGKLTVSSTNLNFWGEGTTVNMRGSSSISAKAISISRDAPQVNLYDNSKITASGAATISDNGSLTANDNSTLSIGQNFKLDNHATLTLNNNASFMTLSECALDRNGAIYVNGNAVLNFTNPDNKRTLKIGDINAGDDGGAVFTQTGGTVTVSSVAYLGYKAEATINISGGTFNSNNTVYFGYQSNAALNFSNGTFTGSGTVYFSHSADAEINLSGGQFIANGNQLYVTDKRGCNAVIEMTNDSYLQAKDLRLSQHGITNLTMSDNSQIKATSAFNMAYNYSDGDNVVNFVEMNDSASVTANNLYFSKGNTEQNGHTGAAYGSLTLNDNASFTVANDTTIGLGTATGIVSGRDYSAEITLNGNSVFTTKTFTATLGTKSATTVNGLATFKADTININGDSEFNVNGGMVNAGSITNSGTLALSGGTLNIGAGGITASGSYAVNLSGGVISTNGASWSTVSTVNATVADNSTVTFEPEDDQTIKWTGAFVNSSQNATIVKSGNGTLKIDSPDENNPSKLDSFVVNAGELDFNGYLTGDITVNRSAVFSPGNSIGKTFETGDFYLNNGGTLLMEIGGSSVEDNDQLTVYGNINLAGGIINLALADGCSLGLNDTIAVKLTANNSEDIANDILRAISSTYFTNLDYTYNADGGYYQITGSVGPNAVPEPSTWALLLLGVAGLLYWRKKKA